MLTDDIITKRLILKSLREEYAPLCLSIWLDEEMGKYLADPPREKASEDYLNFAKDIEGQEGWFPFAAFLKESNDFVGTCSYVPKDEKTWDIGYCVHKNFWRRGYATEMIKAIMDKGKKAGVEVFTAKVAQQNAASNALLRKLGFAVASEGEFKKSCTDIVYKSFVYELK